MTIQIEEGHSYILANGQRVDDMYPHTDTVWRSSSYPIVWAKNGKAISGAYGSGALADWDVNYDLADRQSADRANRTAANGDVKAILADEAKAIVTGARRSAYGAPEDNFERIARFWQAYFENTGRGDVKLTAADVSPMMRLMKEARLCETPDHRDSFVDLIGYTLTGAEINKVDPQKSS